MLSEESFIRTALSRIEPATLVSRARKHHNNPDQTAQTSTQWTALSVVSLNSMSVNQNVNELKQHLLDVCYSMEQRIIYLFQIHTQWCSNKRQINTQIKRCS